MSERTNREAALEEVNTFVSQAQVYALLDIADAIRETKTAPVNINAGHVVPGFGQEATR